MANFWINPFVHDVIGLLAGLLISALFYCFALRRKPKPEWGIVSQSPVLVDNGDVNNYLKISYKERNLDSLSVTSLFFINAGKLTLRGSDVVEPVKFYFENDIIDVYITDTNNKNISVEINLSMEKSNCISVQFENLYSNDYIQFSVIHTGDKIDEIYAES